MEKIHILTDSSSDIPHDLVEAHGIEIVPIMLTHEGRSFREYYDITSEDYCRLLETSSEIPGTAMTTPTVFLESYNRAFERGCTHLLAVLINGGGSGTYQAACLAKSMFEEEQGEGKMTIEVIDSNCYTVGYGYPRSSTPRHTPIFTDTLLSRLPKCASRARALTRSSAW